MASRIRWTSRAIEARWALLDLRFQTGGVALVEKAASSISQRLGVVSQCPRLYGLSRLPALRERGVRATFVDNTVILFRVKEDEVQVLFVADACANYPAYFLEEHAD